MNSPPPEVKNLDLTIKNAAETQFIRIIIVSNKLSDIENFQAFAISGFKTLQFALLKIIDECQGTQITPSRARSSEKLLTSNIPYEKFHKKSINFSI